MNNSREISVHTSNGWETISVPDTSDKHTQTFNSDDPPEVWQPILGLNLFDYTAFQNQYRSFAFACINKKALNLSKAHIYLYKEFRHKRSEQPETHPFIRLTKSTNSYGQSFREILYVSSANCDINGWAYVKIVTMQTPFTELGRMGKTPVELIPLPAKNVMPMYDSQNTMVQYYMYNNEKIMPDEMIRFRVPNPNSNLMPNPPVKAFNFTLEIDYLSAKSRRKFFDNDGRPTVAIEFPTELKKDVFKAYVEEYTRKQAGVNNNGKALVLDRGAKASPLNNNPRELDYVNSREQILQEIELILDVNDQVMGRFKDSNYNNSKNALISWLENTIQPYADMVFNEPLTRFVRDYYDRSFVTSMEYDVTDPEFNLKLFNSTGPITDNEKRRLVDYDDYNDPRADDLYANKETENKPEEKLNETSDN